MVGGIWEELEMGGVKGRFDKNKMHSCMKRKHFFLKTYLRPRSECGHGIRGYLLDSSPLFQLIFVYIGV